MTDSIISLQKNALVEAIEALLFVASGPVSPAQLSSALETPVNDIEEALKALENDYKVSHGLRLQWFSGKVQITTAPDLAPIIEKFLGLEITSRLSRAALETLAIVAYKQPVTRPQLDIIRGVNSDGVIKNLLSKGLIHEVGRTESMGRPILYGVTTDFLQHFGLSSIGELPDINEAREDPLDPKLAINGNRQPILKD
jgi:segregation and condensation protein B